MSDLKCPYCPEVRPSRSRLQQHVDGMHHARDFATRKTAVQAARTVETVELAPDGTEESSAGTPTPQDRRDLAVRLANHGKALEGAGHEMAQLRYAFDDIDKRMIAMQAALTRPSVVRRATLNQVWDRLIDEGHVQAALVIAKMLKNVVDD